MGLFRLANEKLGEDEANVVRNLLNAWNQIDLGNDIDAAQVVVSLAQKYIEVAKNDCIAFNKQGFDSIVKELNVLLTDIREPAKLNLFKDKNYTSLRLYLMQQQALMGELDGKESGGKARMVRVLAILESDPSAISPSQLQIEKETFASLQKQVGEQRRQVQIRIDLINQQLKAYQ